MDIGMPLRKKSKAVDWRLEPNSAMSESPLSGVVQRLGRDGDRWRASLALPPLEAADAGAVAAWLDQGARADSYLMVSPPQHSGLGAVAEAFMDGDFESGAVVDWTPTNATATLNRYRLKVKNTTAAAGYADSDDMTTVSGALYALVFDRYEGSTDEFKLEVRNASDDAVLATDTMTGGGRSVVSFITTGTAVYVRAYCNTTVSGDWVFYGGFSMGRAVLVNGASQTGRQLAVDGGPVSTDAMLRAGEFFAVYQGDRFRLHRLVDDLDLDSSGAGLLSFEPALRASPVDDAPVVLLRPFGVFRLDGPGNQRTGMPLLSEFGFSIIEDL